MIASFGAGAWRRTTYWYNLENVQVFEGPDRVVLFVEVDWVHLLPGFVVSHPRRAEPVEFLRIDVFPDGRVKRRVLRHEGWVSLSTNIGPIVRGQDGFFLIQGPSMGQPHLGVFRIHGDWIERLSKEESRSLVESAGIEQGRGLMDQVDAISEIFDWRRLNDHSYSFGLYPEGITSDRHGVRVRGAGRWIVAESVGGDDPWKKTVVSVNRRVWKSYRNPIH